MVGAAGRASGVTLVSRARAMLSMKSLSWPKTEPGAKGWEGMRGWGGEGREWFGKVFQGLGELGSMWMHGALELMA